MTTKLTDEVLNDWAHVFAKREHMSNKGYCSCHNLAHLLRLAVPKNEQHLYIKNLWDLIFDEDDFNANLYVDHFIGFTATPKQITQAVYETINR